MRQLIFPVVVPLLLLTGVVFLGCSESDNPVPPSMQVDYFPFERGTVWTYKTNVFKQNLGTDVTFEMKIDTAWSSDALFEWMMLQVPSASTGWAKIIGLLDSAGVVYSLGDHPREELYPLFKHIYTDTEIVHETITVQGTTYNAVKRVLAENGKIVEWWFVDGIGLVKEHSMSGISLFSDDNRDEVLTELVSIRR